VAQGVIHPLYVYLLVILLAQENQLIIGGLSRFHVSAMYIQCHGRKIEGPRALMHDVTTNMEKR
jgi:hypothetical protein